MADDSRRARRRAYEREWQRNWRAAHPEEARARSREASRKWRARNPGGKAEEGRRYREKHHEEVIRRGREYVKRRSPMKDQMRLRHGRDWRTAFNAFWELQGGCCYLCGDPLKPVISQSTVIRPQPRLLSSA